MVVYERASNCNEVSSKNQLHVPVGFGEAIDRQVLWLLTNSARRHEEVQPDLPHKLWISTSDAVLKVRDALLLTET